MEKCDIKYALELLQGKWRLRIIWELIKEDTVRFNELQRRVPGISAIALSNELKQLGELGLVDRKDYQTSSPHVSYALTELGKRIEPAIFRIGDWGAEVRLAGAK